MIVAVWVITTADIVILSIKSTRDVEPSFNYLSTYLNNLYLRFNFHF